MPSLMEWDDLVATADRTVAATRRRLPPALRNQAHGVPVTFERIPSDAMLAEGLAADLLGLFVGGAFGEADSTAPLPAQIILFLENLWEWTEQDPDLFRDEVKLTYLHELGHYFGWDETDLDQRGLA